MPTYFGTPPKSPFALPGTYITPEGKKSYGGGSAWTEQAKQELLKPTKKKGGGGGSSGQSLQKVTTPQETALTPVIEQAKQQTLSEQLKAQQAKPSSTISAYTGQEIKGEPLMNWGQAFKSSAGNIWYDIKLAFGGRREEDYRKPLEPFQYTSPIVKKETFSIIGGEPEQIKFPKMETIRGATYVPETKFERVGTGAFITKYGETAGVAVGGLVVPELTGGYLMLTGLEKFSKGENVEGLIRFGSGTIPLASELRNIAKPLGDITKIRIGELTKQKGKLTKQKGKIIGEEVKGGVYNMIVQKKLPYAEQTTILRTATKLTGDKTFSIPTMRAGYTKTIVEDWWTGKPIEQLTKFTTAGKGEIVDFGVAVSKGIKIPISEDIVKSVGEGYLAETGTITKFLGKTTYTKGTGFIPFKFGGLTKTGEEFYSVAGIKPTSARIYLGEQFGKKTIVGDISQYGFIKKYTSQIDKDIIGKGTIQTFKKATPSGFMEQVSKTSSVSTMEKITSMSVENLKGISGLGFLSTQLPKGLTKTKVVSTYGLDSTQLINLGQQQKAIPVVIPRTISLLSHTPTQRNIVTTFPKTTELTKQIERTGFTTPISHIPTTPIPSHFIPGITTPFIIPQLPSPMGWGEGLGRGFKVSRKYKYTPNIGSVLAGFKMPKMTKGIKFAELSGVLPRPIISGISSKRRRKASGSKKKKK